ACTREVYGRKVAFTCTNNTTPVPAPPAPTPPPVPASARTYEAKTIEDPVTVQCAASALDAAELAHTGAAFDVYGGYARATASGAQRLAPICPGDFEQ